MNNILIVKKEDVLNPKLVDSTLPLFEMDWCDMLIPQKVIDLLDIFIVVDIEADEYTTIKNSQLEYQDDHVYDGIYHLTNVYGDIFNEFTKEQK